MWSSPVFQIRCPKKYIIHNNGILSLGSETSTLGLKFSASSTCGIPLPLSKYGEEVISSLFFKFGSSLIEHYSLKWGFKHRGRKHRGPLPQGPKYELKILNCELRSRVQFNFELRIANCVPKTDCPFSLY